MKDHSPYLKGRERWVKAQLLPPNFVVGSKNLLGVYSQPCQTSKMWLFEKKKLKELGALKGYHHYKMITSQNV